MQNVDRFAIVPNAKSVLDICKSGKYSVNSRIIDISCAIDRMKNNTDFVSDKKVYPSFNLYNKMDNISNIEIELTTEKTVDAILRLRGTDNLGVLNFASARNPGGGWLTGAKAQEESLCLCSALYESLMTEKGQQYYTENFKHTLPDYTDNMIYSPKVPFFKDGDYKNVDYVLVDVITCPAINRGAILKRVDMRNGVKESDWDMKNRMFKILLEFKERRCKTLILGAFGCGVFDNDPNVIAKNWIDLINLEVFENSFDKIVFAVFDRPPKMSCYSAFERQMGGKVKILK